MIEHIHNLQEEYDMAGKAKYTHVKMDLDSVNRALGFMECLIIQGVELIAAKRQVAKHYSLTSIESAIVLESYLEINEAEETETVEYDKEVVSDVSVDEPKVDHVEADDTPANIARKTKAAK